MVEAIGNALDQFRRCDSQELARRVLDTVIIVLTEHALTFDDEPETAHARRKADPR